MDDNDYESMLHSVDLVLVLTKSEYCLLCGCYEAVASEKPLITSNTNTLKEYFKGVYFVNNNGVDIASSIKKTIRNTEYNNYMKMLKKKLKSDWQKRYADLESNIKVIEIAK
jgi:hypothetical protein